VFTLIGRLAPGASLLQAGAELAPLAAAQEHEHPESYAGLRYRAVLLDEALIDHLGRRISWMLLGLSGFVLLIACANLANLQLARASTRTRELAIRAALGASRSRLVAQQLMESLAVSVAGGALGLTLASGVTRFLERAGVFGGLDLSLDGPILGLTLALSLCTGVVFGLVPAWLASRPDVNTVLKQQTRGTGGGRGHLRLRQALIVAEVSLAFVLLGGAVFLQRGFARLLRHDGGWDASRLLIAALPVPESRIRTDAERIRLFDRLEHRLAGLPGVEHAALATSLPVAGYNGDRQVLTEGQSPADAARLPAAFHVMVSSDYFAVMGIPLLEGRLFPAGLKASDPRVVVINEALARRLWPGRSALGQRLGSMDSGEAFWAEVIGVVRDVDAAGSVTAASTPFQVYKPLVHEPWSYLYAVVRSAAPASLAEELRRAIADVDADLVPDQVGVVRQLVEARQHNLLLAARTLAGFALLGLVLAAVGLYGVISNLVAQRTGEFGVRLALGARPCDVLAQVLGQGLRLTAAGLLIGLGGVWALDRFLGSLLPRLAGVDPLALAGVATGLFGVALLASFIPARRATKVDPIEALRSE
jgi:predicted permease